MLRGCALPYLNVQMNFFGFILAMTIRLSRRSPTGAGVRRKAAEAFNPALIVCHHPHTIGLSQRRKHWCSH